MSPTSTELSTEDVAWLRVESEMDSGTVRRRAVELAVRVGLPEVRTAEVAIVATELATNLYRHAVDGVVALRVVRRGDVGGVEMIALDRGPGLRNVRALFQDGSSSRGSLGIGLGAVQRLASHHDVHSTPGLGTVITATFWQTEPGERASLAGLTRPLAGEEECGDAYAVRRTRVGWLLLSVDGLGHGPLAARAANQATRIFRESAEESPRALMTALHAGLTGTRGAAAAVGHLDQAARRLHYTGVGNIAGRLVGAGRARGLLTFPGIVGHNAHTIKEMAYDLEPGSWVVMHSDGLSDKWSPDDTPGLLDRSPLVVAATLMRDAAVHRDDASILVARVDP